MKWHENDDGRIEDEEGREVAKVIVLYRSLVSAAPELLDVCKSLKVFAEGVSFDYGGGEGLRLLEEAKTIIAKAEGGDK